MRTRTQEGCKVAPGRRHRVVRQGSLDEYTFGNLQHLYADNWSQLGWSLSRDEFISWLDSTRLLRNLIAHFDDPDENLLSGIEAVHRLTTWLSAIKTPEVLVDAELSGS